ncbi:MAG: hypothetical protein HFJ27_02295 [Clostridia bacterium]|nr:hypothetical protein [Clostridia bacterium]
MIVVPLDKALPDNEIESSVIRSEVEAVIFDKKYLEVFKGLQSNPDCKLKHFICMDFTQNQDEILSLSCLTKKGKNLLEHGDHRYHEVIIDNTSMTIMLFTSRNYITC